MQGAHEMILEMVAWRDPNLVSIKAFYGDDLKVNFCGKLATDPHLQVGSSTCNGSSCCGCTGNMCAQPNDRAQCASVPWWSGIAFGLMLCSTLWQQDVVAGLRGRVQVAPTAGKHACV